MTRLERLAIAGAVAFLGLPHFTQPTSAQTCVPLEVVGTNSVSPIEKTVSPPPTGVTGDNWHTDFAVRSNQSFSRYVASIQPANGGEYTLQLNLKYSDDTVDRVYEQVTYLPEGQTFTIAGVPRASAEPYQVNVRVGGIPVIGNSYRVSVAGCR